MPDLLDPLLVELNANSARAEQLAGRHPAQRWTQRPRSGGWSAAECLEHLTITTNEYLPIIEPGIHTCESRGKCEAPRLEMDWMGALLKWLIEPPFRIKAKTLPKFVPVPGEDLKGALPRFISSQTLLASSIERSRGLSLEVVKVRSPFNERLSYNIFSCFNILLAHQRRHLWQAENALKNLEDTHESASSSQ